MKVNKRKCDRGCVVPVGFEPEYSYDQNADVMYISFGKPKPCGSEGVGNGTDIRITPDGEYNGITIVDYNKRVTK